jgi:hypothetical protein
LRHEITNETNQSSDSDCNGNAENQDNNQQSTYCLINGVLKILGNLTHKANEHIINMTMRQADRTGVMKTIGFSNQTTWLRDNICGWFANGGILDG